MINRKKQNMIQLIGYLAAIFTASTMAPQIIRSIRTKSVEDISLIMISIYVLNTALWLTYGILIKVLPIIIADGIAFCAGTMQLIIKLKYQRSLN